MTKRERVEHASMQRELDRLRDVYQCLSAAVWDLLDAVQEIERDLARGETPDDAAWREVAFAATRYRELLVELPVPGKGERK